MEYRRRRDVSLSELAVCGVAQLELRRLGEGHDIRKGEFAQKPVLWWAVHGGLNMQSVLCGLPGRIPLALGIPSLSSLHGASRRGNCRIQVPRVNHVVSYHEPLTSSHNDDIRVLDINRNAGAGNLCVDGPAVSEMR